MSHLIYDPEELSKARAIVVCVPGALSSINIFEPVTAWRAQGYGVALYPFPGLDGRAISPKLNIAEAADEIIKLARAFPGKPLRLLGYSTGGPVVITAAARLQGDVKTAGMAPAVENGGGPRTGLAGLLDIVRAAWRVKSLRRNRVWMAYYRVLLFGRSVETDKDLSDQADRLIKAHKPQIVLPDGGKPRAHTDDLRHWRTPEGATFTQGQMRFFVGLQDPVFTLKQTQSLARKLGDVPVTGYPDHGHLLFLSHKPAFDDIRAFFEGAVSVTDGTDL